VRSRRVFADKFCAEKFIPRAADSRPLRYRRGMANVAERTPGNVPGPYYVDASCIDCDQCRALAPDLFERNPDTGMGFVKRQPATEDEKLLAEEARLACATESIGNDGA
jgi:ferredoxin